MNKQLLVGLHDQTARQRILAVARQHFLAHGFHRVTMDDLANELGMSKKTIYTEFASKPTLVEAVLLEKFRSIEEELEVITAECSSDFLTGLERLLACVQGHTDEIRPPFLRDMQREAPELFKLVQARRREIIQHHFGALLGEGRRAGQVRKDVPVYLIIEILLGAVEAMVTPARLAELNLSPKDVITPILSVILEGALTSERKTRQSTRVRTGNY